MSVEPWVVSSAVGVRKPDPRIFEALRLATGGSIVGAVFVDDTAKNLDAASNLGLHTVHYRGDSTTHAVASTWRDVEDVVAGLRH
jgi:putative hydrolase of the HAD superfamily